MTESPRSGHHLRHVAPDIPGGAPLLQPGLTCWRVERVFPPIPSEVIMPLSGYVAARGQLTFAGVLLAGTAGSLAGALFWYAVGRWIGRDRLKRFAARHGRWLTLSPAEVDRASAWFARRGVWAVLVGRLVPGVRTLVSVPAGVAGMPLIPFLLASAVGTLLWTGLLGAAGYVLAESYRAAEGGSSRPGTRSSSSPLASTAIE